MSRVLQFDFSKLKATTEKRLGTAQSDQAWADLTILLSYLERNPSQRVPVTEAADEALHALLLDTPAHLALSEAVGGKGVILSHDPNAYGTAAFAAAWSNTREAFITHGIDLPEDYRADQPNAARRAAACWVTVHKLAA